MHTERRILINTVMLSAGEGVGQLTNFVVVISLARAFGTAVLGQYSVSMAVGALAALLVGLGTQPLLIREISRNRVASRELLGVLLPAQVILGAVGWLLACLLCLVLIGEPGALPVIAATAGYQILLRLATTLLAPFQATEQMHASVAGQVFHRLLTLTLALVAIAFDAAAGTVVLSLVAGAVFLIAYAWIAGSRRFGRPRLQWAPSKAGEMFRLASPFLGLTALGVIYARGGLIMLSALAGSAAVGLYAVVDRFMVAAALVPGVFNSAVYPALSRLADSAPADAQALAVRCLRLLAVATFPLATLIHIFADDIVGLVFGTGFLSASAALRVLAWTLPIRGAQWLLGSQLAAMDRQAQMAKARSIGLGAFLTLTPLLIIGGGITGLAWAVLACDGLQFVLYWRLLLRMQFALPLSRAVLPPACAALGALVADGLSVDLPLLSRVLVVTLVLAFGLWISGAIRRQDLGFLRALLGARRT